mmetsp:Transcript_7298/g.13166  ORF Transcript_7298/g.13166 Transcript_7298/m.13166 type:complete len:350 (+) Transcript_7298:531-1580(+)
MLQGLSRFKSCSLEKDILMQSLMWWSRVARRRRLLLVLGWRRRVLLILRWRWRVLLVLRWRWLLLILGWRWWLRWIVLWLLRMWRLIGRGLTVRSSVRCTWRRIRLCWWKGLSMIWISLLWHSWWITWRSVRWRSVSRRLLHSWRIVRIRCSISWRSVSWRRSVRRSWLAVRWLAVTWLPRIRTYFWSFCSWLKRDIEHDVTRISSRIRLQGVRAFLSLSAGVCKMSEGDFTPTDEIIFSWIFIINFHIQFQILDRNCSYSKRKILHPSSVLSCVFHCTSALYFSPVRYPEHTIRILLSKHIFIRHVPSFNDHHVEITTPRSTPHHSRILSHRQTPQYSILSIRRHLCQ